MGVKIGEIFYHQIDKADQNAILESIVYFEWKKLQEESTDEILGEEKLKEQIRILVQQVKEVWEQFYRFSIFHDDPEQSYDTIEVIWEKLQELNGRQVHVSEKEVITQPVLKITEKGLCFSREYIDQFEKDETAKESEGRKGGVNAKKQIYDELKRLQILEKENGQEYVAIWEKVREKREEENKENVELSEQNFPRFFYYGIEDKEEVVRGILYFKFKQYFRQIHQVDLKLQKESLIEKAKDTYKQFYRFVVLNDCSENYCDGVYEKEVEHMLAEELERMQTEKIGKAGENECPLPMILFTQDGMYFNKKLVERFDDQLQVENGKYNIMQNWTKEIYQELEKLERLEQTDPIAYYEKWIETKLHRAMNRQNIKEVEAVNYLLKEFKKRKKQLEEKKLNPYTEENQIE